MYTMPLLDYDDDEAFFDLSVNFYLDGGAPIIHEVSVLAGRAYVDGHYIPLALSEETNGWLAVRFRHEFNRSESVSEMCREYAAEQDAAMSVPRFHYE